MLFLPFSREAVRESSKSKVPSKLARLIIRDSAITRSSAAAPCCVVLALQWFSTQPIELTGVLVKCRRDSTLQTKRDWLGRGRSYSQASCAPRAMTTSVDQETRRVVVGGAKGHVEETISGSLLSLYDAYEWRMIPKCTGRYTCKNHDTASLLTPLELLERAGLDCTCFKEYDFSLPGRSDNVRVVSVDGANNSGLISFVKESSSDEHPGNPQTRRFVHTLNTQSGFRRKLQAIGITVTDSDITC